MFSVRSSFPREPNRYSRMLAELRARGETILDLTASNPTCVGFAAPEREAVAALDDPRALVY